MILKQGWDVKRDQSMFQHSNMVKYEIDSGRKFNQTLGSVGFVYT